MPIRIFEKNCWYNKKMWENSERIIFVINKNNQEIILILNKK